MDNGTGPNCQSAYHYWQWLIVCWVGRRKPHFHHHRVTAIKIFYKHMKSIFVCSFRLSVCQKEHGATQIHYSYMHNNLHFTDVIISKGPSTKHQNSMHGRLTICTELECSIPLTNPASNRFHSNLLLNHRRATYEIWIYCRLMLHLSQLTRSKALRLSISPDWRLSHTRGTQNLWQNNKHITWMEMIHKFLHCQFFPLLCASSQPGSFASCQSVDKFPMKYNNSVLFVCQPVDLWCSCVREWRASAFIQPTNHHHVHEWAKHIGQPEWFMCLGRVRESTRVLASR